MSVLTSKRLLFAVVAALLFATAVFAAHPAPRSHARMAYDAEAKTALLFGGESPVDPVTQISYDSDENWIWNGSRWAQIFPATHPTARTGHGMVYDSIHSRIVLFGGRQAKTTLEGEISLLNDTWVWEDSNWRAVSTPNAPDARHLFAMTYDSARDRVVLFGGAHHTADGKLFEAEYDTWEFDGTTWTKVAVAEEPKVNFPQLAYDEARNQLVLMGTDSAIATLMYIYDPAARTWNKQTPEKLPSCVNDASMAYRSRSETIVLVGGVCSLTESTVDQTWEWNGTNWAELEVGNPARATAQAITYDALHDTVVIYGGIQAFLSVPRSATLLFHDKGYRGVADIGRPSPRSLGAFQTDSVTNTLWLFGGLDELSSAYIDDFDPALSFNRLWGYRGGSWFSLALDKAPSCGAPLSAYDTTRSTLVVTCFGSDTFEFNGTEWKQLIPKTKPPSRRFAGMVYDETLKKTVLFGGFDDTNYRNDTWTWDGTDWTEVKKDKPTNRGLMAMWYDPLQKKTIIYGGLGRKSIDERITRYSDMYAFSGTGWTKLNVSTTPGERMGPQIAIDRSNGKLVLFGGLRSVLDTSKDTRRQFFDNDTWQWDGSSSTWTLLSPPRAPHARENGMMAWDPLKNEIVLFGGYAGFYYSDTWAFNGQTWSPRADPAGRRRTLSGPHEPVPPSIDAPSGD